MSKTILFLPLPFKMSLLMRIKNFLINVLWCMYIYNFKRIVPTFKSK